MIGGDPSQAVQCRQPSRAWLRRRRIDQTRTTELLSRVFRVFWNEQRDPSPVIDICDACTLTAERRRMIEGGPAAVLALFDGARRADPVLVARNVDADGPVRRANEHVVFLRVHAPEVVGAMDAAFGGLEPLARGILVDLSAPILDRDRPLCDDVVDVARVVVPQAGGF